MNSVALIRRLLEHRVWVNGQLRAAAGALTVEQIRQPFDIGRGSLWATLVHLYGAEHAWLEALLGRPDVPPAGPNAFETLEELQIAWSALDRRWQRFVDELTPARLDLPVHKISTAYGAGRMYATPAYDVLLHVHTHAQYTAAQAVNMLRKLGVPAKSLPDPQLITLSRQQASATAAE